jgi:hypothetical protein
VFTTTGEMLTYDPDFDYVPPATNTYPLHSTPENTHNFCTGCLLNEVSYRYKDMQNELLLLISSYNAGTESFNTFLYYVKFATTITSSPPVETYLHLVVTGGILTNFMWSSTP